MKKMNFCLRIMFVLTMSILVSCVGEDGEIGPAGEDGVDAVDGFDGNDGSDGQDGTDGADGQDGDDGEDGTDGADGADGEDGTDGNANVNTYVYDISDFAGNSDFTTVNEITQDVMDNDVILLYVTSLNTLNSVYTSSPVPGIISNGGFLIGTEIFPRDRFSGNVATQYYNFDGTLYTLTAGGLDELKIIIIESTSTTDVSGRTLSAQETILNELEAAGVDTDNYDEVVAYYNL